MRQKILIYLEENYEFFANKWLSHTAMMLIICSQLKEELFVKGIAPPLPDAIESPLWAQTLITLISVMSYHFSG